MTVIGTPTTDSATKVMILGAGELSKETAIEAQRLGLEVIAVDRYEDAPAMQVAHQAHVIQMSDGAALRALVEKIKPDIIIPGSEFIAADTLIELEQEGIKVAPSARAAKLGTDRAGIRQLVAEELKIPTSPYRIATTMAEYWSNIGEIGFPCVVKPIKSASGKGHSVLRGDGDTMKSWQLAQDEAHEGTCGVIIEGFVDFDYEVTILAVRHQGGTHFCEPIGHRKANGNFRESWQPHPMNGPVLARAHEVAGLVTDSLGGFGVFSVELFVKDEEVYFSKVASRPHDTGIVTLVSQNLSEVTLHLRAILGMAIPEIKSCGPASAAALIVEGDGTDPVYTITPEALDATDTSLRLFGKTEVHGERPMGVALALGDSIEEAREKAMRVVQNVEVSLS